MHKWIRGLQNLGIVPYLFSYNKPRAKSKSILEDLQIEYQIHELPGSMDRSSTWIRFPGCILAINKIIRVFKPDLLHAHYIYVYGLLGTFSRGSKIILSAWGSDVLKHPHESSLKNHLIRNSILRATCITATSLYLREAVREHSGRTATVIPFGVDTQLFRPIDHPLQPGRERIVIGTIKWLERIYGIDLLIRAYHRLKQKYPGQETCLLIIGSGAQKRELRDLVLQLDLTDQVRFIDQPDTSEMWRYHNMIDIFVNLSRSESFGVSVLEASACEKPVVASKLGGLLELVEEGVTGILVDPENPDEVAAALYSLVTDPEKRNRMGVAGRALVQSRFEWDLCIREMHKLYLSVIDGTP